jgi:hypothetical protein
LLEEITVKTFKRFLVLTLLAGGAYLLFKLLPPYLHSLQMQEATKQAVRSAALQKLRPSDLRAQLVEKAVEYGLPGNAQIEVVRQGRVVGAQVLYTEEVRVGGYRYTWPFRIREEERGF